MKLDVRRFKKVSSDKTHTLMRNDEGHEIKIAHAALSPKVRSQLAEIPASGPKPVKMADGGDVKPKPSDSPPEPKKKAAEDFQKGFENPDPLVRKVKEYFGYADGGEVKKDTGPAIDPEKAKKFVEGFNNPEPTMTKVKRAFGFADGGEVDEQAPAPEPQAPTPININIGGGGQGFTPVPAAAQPMAQAPQAPAMPEEGSQPYGTGGDQPYGAPAGTPMPAAAPSAPIEPQAAPQAAPASMPQAQGQGLAQAAPSQAGNDPFGTQTTMQYATQGIEEQRKGIQGVAAAQTAQAQAEAKALQDTAQQQFDAKRAYEENFNKLNSERQAIQNDIQNGHVDPNHFWSSRSTVGKVGTIIGMLLSGLGSGASGQPNMAVQMLNDNITRDIEAQKAEMDKKNNLLAANFKQFGNLKDATDMTRVMMNDMVANKIKLAAAQSGSQMAQAAAMQHIGALDSSSAAIMGQNAMRNSLLSGLKSGAVEPEKVVNLILPPEQRPAANKELAEAQHMMRVRDDVLAGFDEIAQLNTVGNRFMSPGQVSARIKAIEGRILPMLSKDTTGKYTQSDSDALGNVIHTNVWNNHDTTAKNRVLVNQLLTEKMQFPILKAWNIDPTNAGRFDRSGNKRYKESAPK